MVSQDFFNFIGYPAQGLYKDKGSTFISYLYPVLDEKIVKDLLSQLKKEHPRARHICFAYRWGPDPSYQRVNDDGEPAGTAGKPILNQLKSFNLENSLIAVVRYFGGTLLGIPGLVNAYKQAALDGILHSKIIHHRRNVYFGISFPYDLEKHILVFLKNRDGEIIRKDYSENVNLEIAFPLSKADEIADKLIHNAVELHAREKIKCTYLSRDQF